MVQTTPSKPTTPSRLSLFNNATTRGAGRTTTTVLWSSSRTTNKTKKLIWFVVVMNFALYAQYMNLSSSYQQSRETQLWIDFAQNYRTKFHGKQPPRGMETWLHHANKHKCDVGSDNYVALDHDLDYFRQLKKGMKSNNEANSTGTGNINNGNNNNFFQWDRVFEEASQITNHYMAFTLQNHTLTLEEYKSLPGHDWQKKPILRLIRKLMKPVIGHKPPLTSKFVFNLHDAALPASVHAKYPLFSVCKMDYYTDDRQTPPPTTTATTASLSSNNNATNNAATTAITTYNSGPSPQSASDGNNNNNNFVASKDLLVPWWFSLRFQSTKLWFWPFFNGGLPFWLRRDAITWRGSTTSAWETGPRFQLVRQYGGSEVHELLFPNQSSDVNSVTDIAAASSTSARTSRRRSTNVDADFAFIRIVQEEHFPPLTPGYRFAPHMFYWQMQMRKYILDVDGNGFTSRFPGLLRSGSLVFKSTRYREWFHGILKPYEDYIPVNYNFTDLAEKVAWANDNPQTAQRIVRNSRRNVEKRMRVKDMQCYMYRLMLEYQTLFEEEE